MFSLNNLIEIHPRSSWSGADGCSVHQCWKVLFLRKFIGPKCYFHLFCVFASGAKKYTKKTWSQGCVGTRYNFSRFFLYTQFSNVTWRRAGVPDQKFVKNYTFSRRSLDFPIFAIIRKKIWRQNLSVVQNTTMARCTWLSLSKKSLRGELSIWQKIILPQWLDLKISRQAWASVSTFRDLDSTSQVGFEPVTSLL